MAGAAPAAPATLFHMNAPAADFGEPPTSHRTMTQRRRLGIRALVAAALAPAVLAGAGDTTAGGHATPREPAAAAVDRFDGRAAMALVRRQVRLGPRPAGSPASRRLADSLRRSVPNGRFQPVPGGLRNVIGVVPGRDPERVVVVGAHYDTYAQPGFLGANDGASGVAVTLQLARSIRPRTLRSTVVFAFFDGEEAPPGTDFEQQGMRGSKVAARAYRHARAAIVLDMVGDRDLSIPRESGSNRKLWTRLREAAARVGAGPVFPPRTRGAILDDHVPFRRLGVPAIDVIDFDFACWHQPCDRLSAVSERSLDRVGETVLELLRRL